MKHKMVTGKEKASYGLYFLGQNIFYMLMFMFLNTYFTDIGITTGIIAIIFLTVKVWDAINDPIFGALMDKIRFKKGKFVPWLRISLIGIPLSTVILFSIPVGVPMGVKIAWAVIGYMLWDTSYTLCDVPIFGLVTTITDVQEERTSLQAIGRICAMLAAMSVMIVVPGFRQAIGGWTETIIMLSVIGAITMIPICFTAKERVAAPVDEEQPSYGLRDMFNYLKTNKYLVIYFAAFLVQGTFAVGNSWGMYIARYCLQNEQILAITSIIGIAPTVILGAFVPLICKKVDKFKLFRGAAIAALILTAVKLFVGYQSLPLYLVMTVLCALPMGFTGILMFMFTPDCAEYGCYKTGNSMPGITFATQTFFVKMQTALVGSFAAFVIGLLGFVEGEGAVQPAGFDQRLWAASCILPMIGIAIQLLILRGYKLNDHDVQLMAQANAGEITRAEAESQMKNKY